MFRIIRMEFNSSFMKEENGDDLGYRCAWCGMTRFCDMDRINWVNSQEVCDVLIDWIIRSSLYFFFRSWLCTFIIVFWWTSSLWHKNIKLYIKIFQHGINFLEQNKLCFHSLQLKLDYLKLTDWREYKKWSKNWCKLCE